MQCAEGFVLERALVFIFLSAAWVTGDDISLTTHVRLSPLPQCVQSHQRTHSSGQTNANGTYWHQCDVYLLKASYLSIMNGLCYIIHTGSITIHESMSVHHLPWGSTASGLQPLQDNGTQAPTCHAGVRNCEWEKNFLLLEYNNIKMHERKSVMFLYYT